MASLIDKLQELKEKGKNTHIKRNDMWKTVSQTNK